jgi:hypothetical protein
MFDPDYSGDMENHYGPTKLFRYRNSGFKQMASLSDEDWNHIVSLYDGEIAFTDAHVGRLIEGLEERGLLERTLVVFLSDHGEEFFDHQGFEHGHTLYNELIKVPLVISLPGTIPTGRRLTRQVRLLDVAPTILDVLGIEPHLNFEGVSLLPSLGIRRRPEDPNALLPPEMAYSEALLYFDELKSMSAYPWKLIYNCANGRRFLFNLEDDPGEKVNLIGRDLEITRIMEDALFRTIFAVGKTWYVEMSGGDRKHAFDLDITCTYRHLNTGFVAHRLLDDDGHMLDIKLMGDTVVEPSRVKVSGIRVGDPVRLAFQVKRDVAPVHFNISIDGKPAMMKTFIGENLRRPPEMPFEEAGVPEGNGRPERLPRTPYVVIWIEGSSMGGTGKIELDAETERQLRSLGYIQ